MTVRTDVVRASETFLAQDFLGIHIDVSAHASVVRRRIGTGD